MERRSFRIVSGESHKTVRKLCLSTKFPHQEIRWNCGIFCSVGKNLFNTCFSKKMSVSDYLITHVTNFLRTGLTRKLDIFSDLSFFKQFGVNISIRGAAWWKVKSFIASCWPTVESVFYTLYNITKHVFILNSTSESDFKFELNVFHEKRIGSLHLDLSYDWCIFYRPGY